MTKLKPALRGSDVIPRRCTHRWTAILLLWTATVAPSQAALPLKSRTGGLSVGTFTPPPVVIPSNFGLLRQLQAAPSWLSDVTVTWIDGSSQDVSTIVERRTATGTWSIRKTFATVLDGPQIFVDSGLPPDAEFCYRVTVRGPNGTGASTWPLCVTTQVRNDIPVWRVQVRVQIANVPDAGTDRDVAIWLTQAVLIGGTLTIR